MHFDNYILDAVGQLKNRFPEEYNAYYADTSLSVSMTLACIFDLDELRNRKYRLAIGSSSKNTKTILEQIGLNDYFDAISDGTNIVNSKPDPEVFLKAAEFLSLEPKDCLVVEDALAGIEAAYAGGFLSAGIGMAREHEHVTYKLESVSDLLNYL